VSIVVRYHHHYYSDASYLLLRLHVLPPTYLSEVPTYVSIYLLPTYLHYHYHYHYYYNCCCCYYCYYLYYY